MLIRMAFRHSGSYVGTFRAVDPFPSVLADTLVGILAGAVEATGQRNTVLTGVPVIAGLAVAHVGLGTYSVVFVAAFGAVRITAVVLGILKK